MPPKKKKQPKNAFYFFMLDWKAEKEQQGQRFSGLLEVSQLCSEEWKHLRSSTLNKYKQMEKEAKGKDKSDLTQKFNSLGVSIDHVTGQLREKELFRARMVEEIKTTLDTISTNIDSLKSQYFYLAHCNVYCYWRAEQIYIPSEVAISKFSLKDGVVDTYHVFPAPFTDKACIPLGYKFDVRQSTENVHGIPDPEDFDKVEYDWTKIRADVRKFLMPRGETHLPPVYTIEGDDSNTNCYMSAVRDFFDNVTGDSNDKFRVYSLSSLFHNLYGKCQNVAEAMFGDKEKGFPVEGLAHQQLNRDIYNLNCGLSCEFHEATEFYQNCSLSYVRRWVYIVCEFCCKALKITLIPGHHCISTARIDAPFTSNASQSQVAPKPMEPQSPSSSHHSNGAAAGVFDDACEHDEGWTTYSKKVHNPRNATLGSAPQRHQGGKDKSKKGPVMDDILFIDHSKIYDPKDTRILRAGQSSNVVSELMPDSAPSVRLPTTRGRGELMARALSLQQNSPGVPSGLDEFPTIGAAHTRPDHPAKPVTAAGWGRGFLKQ